MPRYRFEASNPEGVLLSGGLEAATERDAARQLERRGLNVLSLAEEAQRVARGARRRLRAAEVVLSLQELATLLHSGVALADAVATQTEGVRHPTLLAAFEGMRGALRQGSSFSDALVGSGLPLPTYAHALVRAGEASGELGAAVADAARQMEYDLAMRSEMRHALTYPVILVLAGIGAVVLMFTFVVPRFATLLQRAEELPWLAWAVLNGGMFAREHIIAIVATTAALAIAAQRLLAAPERRAWIQDRLERLPVIGPWRIEAELARWSKVLAALMRNRVALLDALALARSGVSSPRRRARLQEVERAVKSGGTLADALQQQEALSHTGYNLVRVGERSGELPAMLQSLAQLSEETGRRRMKQFLALLEPIAIILIGGMIGVIMIGIILAITSANDLAI